MLKKEKGHTDPSSCSCSSEEEDEQEQEDGYSRTCQQRKSHHHHHHRQAAARQRLDPDSECDSDVEKLPDRFDAEGQLLRRRSDDSAAAGVEAVEQVLREVADVMEGRVTWGAVLEKVFSAGGDLSSTADGGSSQVDDEDTGKAARDSTCVSGVGRWKKRPRRRRARDDEGDDGDDDSAEGKEERKRAFGHRRRVSLAGGGVQYGHGCWDVGVGAP